jgi:hypothetical protein
LTTLLILLLYSVPFKEAFGCALLAFYPHIGGERWYMLPALEHFQPRWRPWGSRQQPGAAQAKSLQP